MKDVHFLSVLKLRLRVKQKGAAEVLGMRWGYEEKGGRIPAPNMPVCHVFHVHSTRSQEPRTLSAT